MWYELNVFRVQADRVEALSEHLEEMGALSVTWADQNDNPILEPAPGETPLWPEILLKALFNQEPSAKIAQHTLNDAFPGLTTALHTFKDQAWERVCMDQFQPQSFGSGLWICPSWCTPIEPNAVNVFLDPGMAFGTGTHPTTALCLEWLAEHPPLNQSVIDFGCGSGILAVAARKLGAHRVEAVDIDPQALQAATENAQKNDCFDQQFIVQEPDDLTHSCDLLIANILLGPLQNLKARFAGLLNANGTLVVSGLLTEQADALINSYQSWFQCIQQSQKKEWALLVFKPLER